MADIIEKIEAAVKENKVMIFMKGNRSFPQCGFSAATVAIFDEIGEPYATADVLSDPELRDAIKQFSNWPTIPQVYIDGKFVGGCDIIREMHESGELEPLVKAASARRRSSSRSRSTEPHNSAVIGQDQRRQSCLLNRNVLFSRRWPRRRFPPT